MQAVLDGFFDGHCGGQGRQKTRVGTEELASLHADGAHGVLHVEGALGAEGLEAPAVQAGQADAWPSGAVVDLVDVFERDEVHEQIGRLRCIQRPSTRGDDNAEGALVLGAGVGGMERVDVADVGELLIAVQVRDGLRWSRGPALVGEETDELAGLDEDGVDGIGAVDLLVQPRRLAGVFEVGHGGVVEQQEVGRRHGDIEHGRLLADFGRDGRHLRWRQSQFILGEDKQGQPWCQRQIRGHGRDTSGRPDGTLPGEMRVVEDDVWQDVGVGGLAGRGEVAVDGAGGQTELRHQHIEDLGLGLARRRDDGVVLQRQRVEPGRQRLGDLVGGDLVRAVHQAGDEKGVQLHVSLGQVVVVALALDHDVAHQPSSS